MTSFEPLVEPAPELTREELERYSRNLTLPQLGSEGQRRLKNARVLVVGAGGLGSPALQYLAAAGVGVLGVVDDDDVSISNLHRQVVHRTEDVGRPKVESAAAAVARINPLVSVRTHRTRLGAGNALDLVRQYDLVLDGADNFSTRYVVSDACVLAGVPCVWGSILRFEGRVSVFWSEHGPTYRDLHPDPPNPDEVPSCADGGVLGMLPATIGAVMVTEATKLIAGIGDPLVGRVLMHDALAMSWREVGLVTDPGAPPVREVVAPGPVGPGDAGPADHETVSARELADRMAQRERGEGVVCLVDVREAWERELLAIPGSVAVPLEELLSHGVGALPSEAREGDVVLHCETGARSGRALAALREHYADREERVQHLAGGVRAWVEEIPLCE